MYQSINSITPSHNGLKLSLLNSELYLPTEFQTILGAVEETKLPDFPFLTSLFSLSPTIQANLYIEFSSSPLIL